ncbi:unnamed protein product, partial [Mesorhabditis spiculigera]
MRPCLGSFLASFLTLLKLANGVARFEPASVSDTSLVIKMIKADNVSSFDMIAFIYDLDRLVEFRKTEVKGSQRDQLFSFDGLLPNTWFVFRIHYRLIFNQPNSLNNDLETKQELVVRTKNSSKENPEKVNDTVAFIEETFLGTSDVYIAVKSVFPDAKKVITVIVPEMRCGRGVIKPLAQQVATSARFHFEVSQLGLKTKDCSQICIFPFLRVQIRNGTTETFRAKEWCGTVQEANKLGTSDDSTKYSLIPVLLLLIAAGARL